ncbi:response regulator [Magnetococcales bacterium HHB-1]
MKTVLENKLETSATILIVDDQPESIDIIKRVLEKDFTIKIATRGELALRIAESNAIDLILLDIIMPGMDGFEVCRRLKANKVTQAIPVMFLTSKDSYEDEVAGLQMGAIDFIRKPFNPVVLLARSKHVIALFNAQADQRETEKALLQQGIHLDNVLQSATDQAIITTDENFIIKYFNPLAVTLFNIPHSATVTHSVEEMHQKMGVDPARFLEGIQNIQQHGEHCFEIAMEKADGVHLLDARASGVIDKDGSLVGYCLAVRDVTERKKLLKDLERAVSRADAANHAKSAFLAAMSHDIRTPMNTIIGVTDLLDRIKFEGEESRYVGLLRRAGESLLALLNDILDFSKIEAGQFQLEDATFDLHELTFSVAEIFRFPAEEKGLKLRFLIDPDVKQFVRGDPDRLRQILLNLLSNAVKFTNSGTVQLQICCEAGNHISFIVTDTGVGIPPDKQEEIFSPFTQADASTTRRFGGTGLGLSICHHLAKMMAGSIALTSTPGEGSTFRLRLPLPESKDRLLFETTKEMERTTTAFRDSTLAILLADDAEDNHLLVAAFLKKTPHHLHCVSNGQECLDAFMKGNYDMVLMDIQMPLLDGLEATKAIRSFEKQMKKQPATIIALTAHATREFMEQAIEAGCDLHATKPITRNRLLELVNQFCSGIPSIPSVKERKVIN